MNAERLSSVLGWDSRGCCVAVADAMRWDGEKVVFLWSQVSFTTQPLLLKVLTSQTMSHTLLNTALSEKEGALPNN